MHLPTVARNPLSSTTRRTSSVCRTVSIVRAQVVPPLISSAIPRRADARIDSFVCAASIGHTRFLSQSKRVWPMEAAHTKESIRVRRFHRPHALFEPIDQCQIVSRAAKESLAKMNVRLHKAGQHDAVGRIDRLSSVRANSFADFSNASI